MFFDRKGRHLPDVESYEKLLADLDYCSVACTTVGDPDTNRKYTVSTIWVGADFSFGRDILPAIFETLHDSEPISKVPALTRHSSEEEAQEFHDTTVALILATMGSRASSVNHRPGSTDPETAKTIADAIHRMARGIPAN